ncbi:MAG: DoxX family protein [Oligoflexus sp.]|nr:DoxX family protein [Oligoflexus sp.]
MKALFLPNTKLSVASSRVSIGLLLLRLVFGIAFILHGWGKMQAPMSWMGPDAPVPGFLQFLAAFAEFGGGIAIILGALTPLASLGLICTMVVAVFVHVGKGDGFVGGFEPALVYLCISIMFLLAGPGRYSVDAFMDDKFRR